MTPKRSNRSFREMSGGGSRESYLRYSMSVIISPCTSRCTRWNETFPTPHPVCDAIALICLQEESTENARRFRATPLVTTILTANL